MKKAAKFLALVAMACMSAPASAQFLMATKNGVGDSEVLYGYTDQNSGGDWVLNIFSVEYQLYGGDSKTQYVVEFSIYDKTNGLTKQGKYKVNSGYPGNGTVICNQTTDITVSQQNIVSYTLDLYRYDEALDKDVFISSKTVKVNVSTGSHPDQ